MKRLKYLSLVALVAFAACDEGGNTVVKPVVEGSIAGVVTIEGQAASGVSVSLSSGAATSTDASGSYSFSNVPAGAYTVSISGFASDATFSSTSQAAVISSAGQTVTVNFDGSYVRTASISGSVSAGGSGISGVTVSMTGQESGTKTTDAAGNYAFTGLRAGSYTVTISGFDGAEYNFSSTSTSVTLGAGEAKTASFEGTLQATARIIGSVLVDGQAQEGVTVTMSGAASGTTTTNASGAFEFSGLTKGTYTIKISGFADDAEFGSNEATTTIASASSVASVDFSGTFKKTSSISGQVAVGSSGLANVVVTLTGSASVLKDTTSTSGQYAFTGLRKGDYTLEISGFDANEYSFSATTQSVTLGVDEAKVANFTGSKQATASISGTVTLEGTAVSGATVTLSGDASATDTTGTDGSYTFSGLKAGSYTVAVTAGGPSDATFSSVDVSIASATDSKTADISGTYIRTASISGTVTGDGVGMAGVTVTLSGLASDTTTTDSSGSYAFTGLRAGAYTVTISGFSTDFDFTATSAAASPAVGEAKVVSFAGTEKATATISGSLFIDENAKDDTFTPNLEDKLAVSGVTVTLTGPTVGNTATKTTDANGDYSFTGLKKGNYTVAISPTDANLTGRAVTITTASATQSVTSLAVGGTATVNFPFDIATQQVKAYAYLGTDGTNPGQTALPNVVIDLYDTQANATTGGTTGRLAQATTDANGMVDFTFSRANESSPQGGATDNIVFARYNSGPDAFHGTNGETIIQIAYSPKDSMVMAPDTFDLLNGRVVMKFDAKDLGGNALAGWNGALYLNDTTNVAMATPQLAADGSFTIADAVAVGSLPVTYYFRLSTTQPLANGHGFSQSPSANRGTTVTRWLKFTNSGLVAPGDTLMVGSETITYTDTDLKVRVHHEMDDSTSTPTYTLGDGVLAGVAEAQLYEVASDGTKTAVAGQGPFTIGATGEVTFNNVPTGKNYEVRARTLAANVDVLNDTVQAKSLDGSLQKDSITTLTGGAGYSTFAWKYNDGTIPGVVRSAASPISGLTRDADGLVVRIQATSDNIQPNRGKDTTVVVSGGAYTVSGFREGPYTVSVADSITSTGDTIWHFVGASSATVDLQGATDNKITNFTPTRMDTQIKGVIANDRDQDLTTIDLNEALSGAVVQLYRDNSGTATVSTDSLVATDTTDANGQYSFSKLMEAQYIVKWVSGTPDTNQDVLRAISKDTAVVTTAAETVNSGSNGSAVVGTHTFTAGAPLPEWDYGESKVNFGSTTHFTFLFKNGVVKGQVTNAGVGVSGMTVSLRRCDDSTANAPAPNTLTTNSGPQPVTANTKCTTYLGTTVNTVTDSNGNFEFSSNSTATTTTSIIEGVYEITPQPGTVGGFTSASPAQMLFLTSGNADTEVGNFTVS